MLKSYPKEIRERARELFLERPELSYSDIAAVLYEEFPDKLSRPPNKTTIRNWVKDLRKKRLDKGSENEKNTEESNETEKEEKLNFSGEVPPELNELPKITPPEIAERLAEKSVVVNDERPSAEEIEEIVEDKDEENRSFMSKIKFPHGKIVVILLAGTIIGLVIYFLIRRKKEPEKKTAVYEEPPKEEVKKTRPKVLEL